MIPSVPAGLTAAAVLLAAAILGAALLAALWARERRRARRLQDLLDDERSRHQQTARASDSFFHSVSHELRSPIATILGYQELLGDGAYGQVGDGAAEPVHRIGRSARHLLHLVDGAVDLGRVQAGMAHPAMEAVDLGDLLEEAARDFRTYAEERKIEQHSHIGPVPSDFHTDPERLGRALHLLAVAAVRSPARALELHVDCLDDGVHVRIRGARVPTTDGVHDVAVECGVRVAIAHTTARLLGGSVQIRRVNDAGETEVHLHVPDARTL